MIKISTTAATARNGRWCRLLSRMVQVVVIAFFVVLQCSAVQVYAFRTGDVIDTDLVVNSIRSDALRSQMPKYAINTIANFPILVNIGDDNDNEETTTTTTANKYFTLQFEDGLWVLPTYAIKTNQGNLEHIVVKFVYSSGVIHAVSANTKYSNSKQSVGRKRGSLLKVSYVWLHEEAVHRSYGFGVLFLIVFVASIYFLLVSCGVIGSDDNDDWNYVFGAASSSSSQMSGSVPKWD